MEKLLLLVMRTKNMQTALDNADEFGYDVAEQYQVEGAVNLDNGNMLCPRNGYIPQDLRTEKDINNALNKIYPEFNGEFDIRKNEVNPQSCEDMSVTNICDVGDPKDDLVVVFVSAYTED